MSLAVESVSMGINIDRPDGADDDTYSRYQEIVINALDAELKRRLEAIYPEHTVRIAHSHDELNLMIRGMGIKPVDEDVASSTGEDVIVGWWAEHDAEFVETAKP